jgi:uncharacterized protein YjiS (DUF1127 family)
MTARPSATALAHASPQSLLGERPSLGVVIFDALSSLAIRLASASRRRRDARVLSEMDDTMLRDIGISRSEIGFAVRHGRTT